jgi:hypothetical protein
MIVQQHGVTENEPAPDGSPSAVTSRRGLLVAIGLAPLVLGAAAAVQAQSPAARCIDPSQQSAADEQLRAALNFQELSKDANRRCSLCAFFTGTSAACGTCQMLSNGPVGAGSVCASFAPKAP